MANCNENFELLSSLIDGELDSQQEAELCAHIETCENCKRVYTALKSISDATGDELVQPPEMLAKGIMFKINAREQQGGKRRFAFGRFTAMAACLAVIILGASRLGLFDSMSAKAPAAKSADMSMEYTSDENIPQNYTIAPPKDDTSFIQPEGSGDEGKSAGITGGNTESSDPPIAIQISIPENVKLQEAGKPPCLFDAKEISLYEGKYVANIAATDYKEPLFTVTQPQQLEMFAILLGEMLWTKDGETAVTPDIPKDDPLYTLFIPANLEKDENAKDTAISIWIIDDELWCLEQPLTKEHIPVSSTDLSSQPKLYKPVALSKELENFLDLLKEFMKIM